MKNIIVTGGAGGIGSQIVREFVDKGFFVYILDIDDVEAGKICEELGPEKCKYLHADVTDLAQLDALCNQLKSDFQVNHIISLAGRALPGEWEPFEKQDRNEILQSIKLNLFGHINVVSSFYPFLKKGSGEKSVLLISSINATGNFGLPAYSASKSGLYGFVNSVVNEFGNDGIRINTLSLGTVVTPATQKEPKNFDSLVKGTAIGEFVSLDTVAKYSYFIAEELSQLTGQDIVLDAGQSKMRIS